MSMPLSVLPRCVGIMSSTVTRGFLYLQGGSPEREDYLIFHVTECITGFNIEAEELASSTHTRFHLDPSKKHEELFHVRCAYNNKYLVAKQVMEKDLIDKYNEFMLNVNDGSGPQKPEEGPKLSFLFDMTDEPEEDLSKPSCTLFRIRVQKSDYVDDLQRLGRHHRVSFARPQSDEKVGFLTAFSPVVYHEVILLDLSEQTILPPHVAFKIVEGEDDFYLKQLDDGFLQFSSTTDITDKSVRFMTCNYADGSVRLKSMSNGRFLKVTDDGLWIKTVGTSTHDDGTLFKALKYGDFFALQTLPNNKDGTFCTCDKDGWLAVGAESITRKAKFMLEEPVLSREIYNVQYHVNHHSRVYDTKIMNVATATATNRTSEKNTVKSSVSITTKESSKWETTNTHKGSIQVTFHAGVALKVLNFGVDAQFGYEFSHATTWGNGSEVEKKQEIDYEVTVPANKKVILSVTATQAKYDVPFSYTQKDKLLNGKVVIENYDDGLYTGMNCFDLRYETREEDIETSTTTTTANPLSPTTTAHPLRPKQVGKEIETLSSKKRKQAI